MSDHREGSSRRQAIATGDAGLERDDLSLREAEEVLRRLAQAAPPSSASARRPPLAAADQRERTPKATSALSPRRALAPEGLPAKLLWGLLEAAPDALVVVNGDGKIVLVNAETEQMFGYRWEELRGQMVELLMPERFRQRHVEQRRGFWANPQSRPMGAALELYGRRRNGEEFPVEISLSPLSTDDGVLVTGMIRDVTARKRAEAQLRKAEGRYRMLIEEIPAVTFMAALDEGLNELYVSPQIEKLLGFSQKEWLEDPVLWYKQLHREDRERWHREFARTCATAEPFRSVYRFVARDGHVVWVHGEAKVFRDDEGRPLFLQGVAFDITGMKRAEENLTNLNLTLEQRVAERTAVAEERARELERSNAALEDFAGMTAHELKEPLRAMKSFTQLLARRYRGRLDEQADEFINRVVNAGNRMEGLISALLDYARVGRQGKPAPVHCGRVFAAACEMLEAALQESTAELTTDDLDVLEVQGVETELILLVKNLIGNAVKFRGDHPVKVHLGVRRDGAEWVFHVRDNGIGIAAEYLPRLFRMGERLHSRRQYPGHGIGLATCKKIVERHGGRIWVESAPGAGSTFFFTLPAELPAEATESPEPNPTQPAA